MLTKIVIGLAVLLVVLVIVVSMQSDSFIVTRSATISAPPATVFGQVNDFHRWEVWSPWAKMDPSMKHTYDGAEAGAGASYSWAGNNKVGEGRMTIVETRPNEFIRIKLEFLKPFAATNTAEFSFQPQGDQTVVVWSMSGKKNFMMKFAHLVMNMDKMVGGDFERGLEQLKAVSAEVPKA